MQQPDIRKALPVHPSPAAEAVPRQVRVDGLVAHPLELSPADLAALPQRALTDDFTCVEGWVVPALGWQGVPLAAVLDLAQAGPEAQWVQASAGDFSVPLPLEDARRALLALRLDGRDLPVEHGGPVRLVVPGRECFTSIKWLDHLELRLSPASNTGQAIALGRLAARERPDR
ncbi:MAG: molybdopterin-dependent oxidoreductase [Chloroflexi bacterium]|nr:molybdopterin-dependent oxidoreductase [Chloroflexota bacterium]